MAQIVLGSNEVLMAYLRYQSQWKTQTQFDMKNGRLWLHRFDQILRSNPGNAELDNVQIAAQIDISERQLFRQVKKITGLSPQKYIRQYRMKLAMNYLRSGTYKTVNETASAIGYTNTSYFIKQFENQFGRKPLQVLREAGWR